MILIQNKQKNHKFDGVYEGPFRVIKAHDTYLEIMKNGKKVKVHKNMAKKAQATYDNEPPIITPMVELDPEPPDMT